MSNPNLSKAQFNDRYGTDFNFPVLGPARRDGGAYPMHVDPGSTDWHHDPLEASYRLGSTKPFRPNLATGKN